MRKLVLFIALIVFGVSAKAAVISNLVRPVHYFVNHSVQLANIETYLNIHNKIGIVGVSGIGKTQLVRQYAYNNQDNYQVIWFFDANADLMMQFVELAKSINETLCAESSCKVSENINDAKKSVMYYLSSKEKFLLVFDNLQVNHNHELQDIIDWENNGHVIFCSQDSKYLSKVIQMPYLMKKDSIELVNKILTGSKPDLVEELVLKLKGYPIAITQSSLFLDKNSHITLEEYNEYLDRSVNKMDTHVQVVMKELSENEKTLLYNIALLNNQRVSKSLLKSISGSKTFTEDLLNITRFGLVSVVHSHSPDRQTFEMHDVIKKSLLQALDKNALKNYLSRLVSNINLLMPRGKNSRQELILQDETLLSNLQRLLDNAEYYEVDDLKIFELRKNMMSMYLGMGVVNCQEMEEWFFSKKERLNLGRLTDYQKAVYAEYLVLIGVYEYFIKASPTFAVECMLGAEQIIRDLDPYPELKYMVYSQLAQAYIFNGDKRNANIYILKSDEINAGFPNADSDTILLSFVKAKYYLAESHYQKALDYINAGVDTIKQHPIDYYYAPIYVMKAEVLNYLGDFKAAYKLLKPIYDVEINEIKLGKAGGIRFKVMVEISRAELGLGKLQKALTHASQAVDVYINDPSRNNSNLAVSVDTDLAEAFVAQGDAMARLKNIRGAIDSYSKAEVIYFNKYRENISNLDQVSYLYWKAVLSASKLKDRFWFYRFKNQHLRKFGTNHFRSIEIMKIKYP